MKISSWIIGLLVVCLSVMVFSSAIADMTSKYGVTYDESELGVFNKTSDLVALTQDIETQEEAGQTSSGVIDLVGGYISQAVQTLKVAKGSLSVFDSMLEVSVEKLGLPGYFVTILYSIALILIIIGVVVSAMVKKDL